MSAAISSDPARAVVDPTPHLSVPPLNIVAPHEFQEETPSFRESAAAEALPTFLNPGKKTKKAHPLAPSTVAAGGGMIEMMPVGTALRGTTDTILDSVFGILTLNAVRGHPPGLFARAQNTSSPFFLLPIVAWLRPREDR